MDGMMLKCCHSTKYLWSDWTLPLQHPYKYAGYPMLIKTIRMETDDEKLFSKSAPLLAAASECAYFTVKCSALNAEEMRRENGLVVLYQVRLGRFDSIID